MPGDIFEASSPTSTREERIKELESKADIMITYLKMKISEKDWHGVQDAASDLRDIEAELKGLQL